MHVKVESDEGDIHTYENARAIVTQSGGLYIYRLTVEQPVISKWPARHWAKVEVTQ